MQQYFLLLCIAIHFCSSAQVSVFECTPANSSFLPSELNNGSAYIEKPCIWLNDAEGYVTDCTPAQEVRGLNEIHLTSDFHAKATGSDADLHLMAGLKGAFDVAVPNFADLNAVQKLKKFEVVASLPNAIAERVANFVNKINNAPQTNPYLDWELRVVCEFYHASSNVPIVIDGFYNKRFQGWQVDQIPQRPSNVFAEDHYQSLGGYNEIPLDHQFMFRFSPPENGKWSAKVKIYTPTEFYESDVFYFNVVESGSLGYMQVGNEKRFLKLGNQSFIPIGMNVTWPFTDDFSDDINPDLAQTLTDNQGFLITEQYRHVRVIPQVYDDFLKRIGKLADNGANMIRVIQHPFSMEIEYEELGNYTRRLHQAQEMDRILEYCEQRGIYVLWDFQIQYPFESGGYYNIGWDKEINGEPYCYRTLVNSTNSRDFFSHEDAKKYYKQRYRYLVSRYGYSTNIAIFELFSEIYAQKDPPVSQAISEQAEQWHQEMGTYIKSLYNGKTHLLTASYAGHKNKTDGTFALPQMDVMSSNEYGGLPTFGHHWSKELAESYLNQKLPYAESGDLNYTTHCEFWDDGPLSSGSSCSAFKKPMILSEFDPNNGLYCDPYNADIRRAMWQVLFSGIAGGFSWIARSHQSNADEFPYMQRFMSQINFDAGNWHPGAMELTKSGFWEFKQEWVDDMDSDGSEKMADVSYLRSGDGNFAIGVITNKTYNQYSTNDCADVFWDSIQNNEDYESPKSIDTKDINLKLRGMNPGKYYVNYFYKYDQSTPVGTSTDVGPKVKLEFIVPAAQNEYIVLFMARRKGQSWMPTNDPMETFIEKTEQVGMMENDNIDTNETAEVKGNETESETLRSDFEEMDIDIFPVPFSNLLNIETEPGFGTQWVEVLSAEGKILQKVSLEEERATLNTENWAKGVYLIQFYANGTSICSKKTVKL